MERATLQIRISVVYSRVKAPYRIEVESAISGLIAFVFLLELAAFPVFTGAFQKIEVVMIPYRSALSGSDDTVAVFNLSGIDAVFHFGRMVYVSDNAARIPVVVGRDISAVVAVVNHPVIIIDGAAQGLSSQDSADIRVPIVAGDGSPVAAVGQLRIIVFIHIRTGMPPESSADTADVGISTRSAIYGSVVGAGEDGGMGDIAISKNTAYAAAPAVVDASVVGGVIDLVASRVASVDEPDTTTDVVLAGDCTRIDEVSQDHLLPFVIHRSMAHDTARVFRPFDSAVIDQIFEAAVFILEQSDDAARVTVGAIRYGLSVVDAIRDAIVAVIEGGMSDNSAHTLSTEYRARKTYARDRRTVGISDNSAHRCPVG